MKERIYNEGQLIKEKLVVTDCPLAFPTNSQNISFNLESAKFKVSVEAKTFNGLKGTKVNIKHIVKIIEIYLFIK